MQFTKLNYEALKTQLMYVVLELSLFIYLFIASHVIFKGIYLSILSLLFTKSPKRIDLLDDSKVSLTE